MKDGEKKVWITLLIVILCAIVIGLFYWLGQQKTQDSEGYLVEAEVFGADTVNNNVAETPNVEVTVYGF